MSNSLQTLGLQHTRCLCPPPSLRVCSDSCPLSKWCYLTISSSAAAFSFAFNLFQHQGLFQSVGSLHQVTKVLGLQLSPPSEYSGLIFFRIEWFDLLAVQGTLKSRLQHHSSKAFFRVQFSHPYMTARKTIALTRSTFVGKVMSLLFNMLSRFVIAFLPRSKRLLVSWL